MAILDNGPFPGMVFVGEVATVLDLPYPNVDLLCKGYAVAEDPGTIWVCVMDQYAECYSWYSGSYFPVNWREMAVEAMTQVRPFCQPVDEVLNRLKRLHWYGEVADVDSVPVLPIGMCYLHNNRLWVTTSKGVFNYFVLKELQKRTDIWKMAKVVFLTLPDTAHFGELVIFQDDLYRYTPDGWRMDDSYLFHPDLGSLNSVFVKGACTSREELPDPIDVPYATGYINKAPGTGIYVSDGKEWELVAIGGAFEPPMGYSHGHEESVRTRPVWDLTKIPTRDTEWEDLPIAHDQSFPHPPQGKSAYEFAKEMAKEMVKNTVSEEVWVDSLKGNTGMPKTDKGADARDRLKVNLRKTKIKMWKYRILLWLSWLSLLSVIGYFGYTYVMHNYKTGRYTDERSCKVTKGDFVVTGKRVSSYPYKTIFGYRMTDESNVLTTTSIDIKGNKITVISMKAGKYWTNTANMGEKGIMLLKEADSYIFMQSEKDFIPATFEGFCNPVQRQLTKEELAQPELDVIQ